MPEELKPEKIISKKKKGKRGQVVQPMTPKPKTAPQQPVEKQE